MRTGRGPADEPVRAAARATSGRPSAPPAARSWEACDPYAAALRAGRGPLFLRRTDGWLLPLNVERWCARADAVDLEVLDRCEGAVLDVGCGPGRLVAELAARGRTVLGIDVSEAAVARTVRTGGQSLRRSVFEPLPGEGRWDTVLLMDGNIGIGGDPGALLARVAAVLAPGGLLIAETAQADVDERAHVQVVDDTDGRAPGSPFPWARVGTRALLRHAASGGWRTADQWTSEERRFVALRSSKSSAEPPNSTAVISSQRVRNPSADSPETDR
ncbi:class I SAM-dependent methyltransferase [Streptomyces sp. NPDC053750]|uniref:class I SAM-dependent methyltransferase n=1 Tax=Streptomyces sp. NPDC053750 TaxID=3365714 RepID=UPI0037D1C19E